MSPRLAELRHAMQGAEVPAVLLQWMREVEDRLADLTAPGTPDAPLPDRRIVFTFDDDFEEMFAEAGFEGVTDEDWREFEKAFMAGINWAEVAQVAADVARVAALRRERTS